MEESEKQKLIEEIKKNEEFAKEEEKRFWAVEYPTLSKEEKIKTWERMIYWGFKSGSSEELLDYFTPQTYNYMKSKDPKLYQIMDEVIERFNNFICGDKETKTEIRKRMGIL